jgi:hypothetical protein
MPKFMVNLRSKSVQAIPDNSSDDNDIYYYTVKTKNFDSAWIAAIAAAENSLTSFISWRLSRQQQNLAEGKSDDQFISNIDETIESLQSLVNSAKCVL